MQDFNQWLETNHPEINEGFLKNATLAGAMALGTLAPNYSQAQEPNQPTTTQQDQMKQLRDQQNNRRKKYKLPIMMGLMGAAAAARAARNRQ
jgi:hypothetical protein